MGTLLDCRVRPQVYIVEVNPNLDPGTQTIMPYDPEHRYDETDYYGASLDAYWRLFHAVDYHYLGHLANLNAIFVEDRDVPGDTDAEQFWGSDEFKQMRVQAPSSKWGAP